MFDSADPLLFEVWTITSLRFTILLLVGFHKAGVDMTLKSKLLDPSAYGFPTVD